MNMRGYDVVEEWLVPNMRTRHKRFKLKNGHDIVLRYELHKGKKRKIIVYFLQSIADELTKEDIKNVAKYADSKGWKKIVIGLGEWSASIEAFNMSNFRHKHKNQPSYFLKWLPLE